MWVDGGGVYANGTQSRSTRIYTIMTLNSCIRRKIRDKSQAESGRQLRAGPLSVSQEREREEREWREERGRRIFQRRRTGIAALKPPPEAYNSSPDIKEQETFGPFEGLTS